MMKVLFVDDEEDLLRQTEVFLEKIDESLEVDTVESAKEALENLKSDDYDVIVSDYQMPRRDGIELLKIVREDKREDIPFIMFTGKGREEVAMEALNLGANRYLKKGGDIRAQYNLLVDAIRQEVNHYNTKKRYRELFHESPIGISEEDFSEVKKKIDLLKEEGIEDIEGYLDDNPGFVRELMEDVEIISVNDAVLDMYRADSQEDFKKGLSKIFGERSIPAFKKVVEKIADGETEFSTDKVDRRLDGEDIHVFLKWSVTAGHEDDYSRVIVSTVNITERKRKEEKLEKNKQRLSRTQQVAKVGTWRINLDSGKLDWSDQTYQIFEIPKEEDLDYDKFLGSIHPEDREFVDEKWEEGLETGKYDIEHRILVDGKTKWVREKANIQYNEKGEPVDVIGSVQDITERKDVEEKLKRSEREKSLILENTDERIAYHDKDHRLRWVNKAYLEATDRSFEDIVGDRCYHAWGLEDPCENCPITRAIETGESYETEFTPGNEENLVQDNGTWLIKANPVRDEDDNIIGAIEVALDITKQKKAIERLKRSEERYKTLFDDNPEATVEVDEDFKIIKVNSQFEKLFKYEEEEILDKCINDLIVPEERKGEADELNKKSIQKGYLQYETVRIDKKGNEVPVSITARPINYSDETHHIAVYKNITDLKQVEKDLDQMEERKEHLVEGIKRYRNLIEASPDTILLIDTDSGDVIDANRRSENLFKMSREKIIGKNISELRPEEEKGIYDKIFKQWKIGDMDYGKKELHVLDRYGDSVPVEIGTSSLELEGKNVIFGVFRNISKRKEAEKRQDFLHSLLRHDVRNKASIVKGYIELVMEEDLDLPESVDNYLSMAEDGIEESMEIINKVSSLRKAQEENVKRVKIDQVIDEVLSHTKDVADEKGIDITCDHSERGQEVKGGSLLDQVFNNIIENAIQHSECSHIKIHSRSTEDEIIYTIEDDGEGIPDKEKEKIFKKGYTTDEERGTGLGMFLVKKLLEIYGAKIELKDSKLGGARFDINFKKA